MGDESAASPAGPSGGAQSSSTAAASHVGGAGPSGQGQGSGGDGTGSLWEALGRPRLAVAPMVEQSELAWRLLSRRHGAELCYTPMLHASVFARDASYRRENLQTDPEDRPLIVQFCGNEAETLLDAVRKLPDEGLDAVDLNLGCPQLIAKRGFYGAFLQDREHWPRVRSIVSTLRANSPLPVTCKIRVFPELKDTLDYARMLEEAGCQLLTVHGRTRDMKGPNTGVADWTQIQAVKAALSIPVFANGNIQYHEDFDRCLEETGVEGVMTAEGNLHNPAITSTALFPVWDLVKEYLDICRQHPTPMNMVRGHVFKLFQHPFAKHPLLRDACARADTLEDLDAVVGELEGRYAADHQAWEAAGRPEKAGARPGELRYPIWVCQPYVRPGTLGAVEAGADTEAGAVAVEKRRLRAALGALAEEVGLSRRRLRKLSARGSRSLPERAAIAAAQQRRRPVYVQCACGNPLAQQCVLRLCRRCCHDAAKARPASCPHHNFFFHPQHPKPPKPTNDKPPQPPLPSQSPTLPPTAPL